MRVAGIDLGTNTFLCLIADIEKQDVGVPVLKVLRDEVRVVRLGQGVHQSRAFHPEALARAEETFKEFQKFIEAAACEKVFAVATSAARDVTNSEALLLLGRKYGISIEVISGQREADLTFSGAMEPSWQGRSAVIDVGGGSTEIIFGDTSLAKPVMARASADVGAVRLTEQFVTSHPISDDVILKMRSHARAAFLNLKPQFADYAKLKSRSVERVIAVAGTPTTLSSVILGRSFDSDRVHGHKLLLSDIELWIDKLSKMTVSERQKLAGMEPKRADVIVAGLICLGEGLRAVNDLVSGDLGSRPRQELTVSVRGLRFGVVLDAFLKKAGS